MMKKVLCAVLCAMLLTACSAQPAATPVPTETPAATQEAQEQPTEDTPHSYTTNDEEYRDLCSDNPIEEGLDELFNNAVTKEDFDALAKMYVAAWQDEYHALMDQLIAAFPDDAEELKGLKEYTDDAAKEAYDNTITAYTYTDDEGKKVMSVDAEQTANFNMAEIYKDATVLSILNDYRGDTPYVFHYTAQ